MKTNKDENKSITSQQNNERIIKILNDSLSDTKVFLHPDRSQDWDDKYTLLIVEYHGESLIIPVPVLKRLSPELAEQIKIKIEEELRTKTSAANAANIERLIEKRTQNLLGDAFFQAEKFALSLDCYIKAGNEQRVSELANLFWSEKYINCYQGDKFLELAVRGYEYLDVKDKLVEIGDYLRRKGYAGIDEVISLYQKAGATPKILALVEAAVEKGDLYCLEVIYKEPDIDISEEQLIRCGDVLFIKKDFYRSLKCYEKANYQEGRKKIALKYLASKNEEKIEEAINILEDLGMLKKKLVAIGNAYHRIGDDGKAIDYYRKAKATKKIAKLAKEVEAWNLKWAIELYKESGEMSQEKYLEIARVALNQLEFDLVAYCYQMVGQKLPEKEIIEVIDKLTTENAPGSVYKSIKAYKILGANEKLVQVGKELVEEKNVEVALDAFKAAGYNLSRDERNNIGDIFLEKGYYEKSLQIYKGSKPKLTNLVEIMVVKDKDRYWNIIVEACKEVGLLETLRLLAKDRIKGYHDNQSISPKTDKIFRAIAELELEKEEKTKTLVSSS